MKKAFVILSVSAVLVLSACGNNSNQGSMDHSAHSPAASPSPATSPAASPANPPAGGHEGMPGMNHSSSGDVPAGLKTAANPTFKVGSQAIMKTDHMPGMNGAKATIVGAYDTTAYAISYTPTTGGPKVTNHKWVVHEELQNAGTAPLKPGAQAVTTADHMPGMKGATVTIDSAEHTTVYMVDYMPTTGGEMVKNHKWVTESELSAK